MYKNKLLVLDLDNTLLHNDKTISNYSIKVLNKFHKLGGNIAIATGRALIRAQDYGLKINALAYITLNGSLTYLNNEIISSYPLDENKITDLMHLLLQIKDCDVQLTYPDKMLINNMNKVRKGISKYDDFSHLDIHELQKISLFTLNYEDLFKINFKDYNSKLIPNATIKDYFVISNTNVDKVNGLKDLCHKMNINLDNVYVFGDDYNDIEILKLVKHSIVVDNALDDIKKYAYKIVASNEDDGPAHFINDYFNLNI